MKPLAGHRVALLGTMAERPLARFLASLGAELGGGIEGASFVIDDLGRDSLGELALDEHTIHVSVTTFGSGGPRSAWRGKEFVASAMGGALRVTGEPGQPPVKEAGDACTFHADQSSSGSRGRVSYAPGEELTLHVSTSAAKFAVEITRLGGKPESVWTAASIEGREHPVPEDASSHGCHWPTAVNLKIPTEWRSGYYHVALRARDNGGKFIQRNTRTAEGGCFFLLRAAEPGKLFFRRHMCIERSGIRCRARVLPGDRRQHRLPGSIDEDVRVDLRADADALQARKVMLDLEQAQRLKDACHPVARVLLGNARRRPCRGMRPGEARQPATLEVDQHRLGCGRSNVDADEAALSHRLPPKLSRSRSPEAPI